MATLNGIEFQVVKKSTTVVSNNIVEPLPGSDETVIKHNGYATAPMVIKGFVYNEEEFDDFKEQFYSDSESTLIIDPSSSVQYTVRGGTGVYEIDGDEYEDSHINFVAYFELKTPYKESVSTTTRSKTITAQNQEWSTDDDSADIKTLGNVDAVPDIQVTGVANDENINQITVDTSYPANAGAIGVTINNSDAAGTMSTAWPNTIGQTVSCGTDGMAIIDSIKVYVDSLSPGSIRCDVYDAVGGTHLGSKTITHSSTGWMTFTFDTPIIAIKDNTDCSTSVIYFKIASQSLSVFAISKGDAYTGGDGYINDVAQGEDLYFSVTGHSVKEVHQTFQVNSRALLKSVLIKGCDFNYSGSNVWTAKIYQSTTLLGTGTVATPGASFTEIEFILTEETTDSLILLSSIEYTIKIYPPSDSVNANSVLIQTNSSSVYSSGAVTLIEDGGTSRAQTHDIYFKIKANYFCKSPQIYNTSDTTAKCNVANDILNTAIHRINADGTGTVDYDDNITTDKYFYSASVILGVTYDDGNNKLDIADDGYIYWKQDTKLPINGIPTLTSRIDIISGIPTIQISTDASTWYDIDTGIVDDVETVYPLDSDGNLSLAGKTVFYWRIDCVKAAAATCSIKYFELDINIHTIYAKNPKITKGTSASTFRIDQDSNSGMACTVDLIFKDRWWA